MSTSMMEPRVPRFTRRLLVGVVTGFVAILLTLVAIGITLGQRQRAIQRDLDLIADVEEPESAAAYEMEINVLGAGLAVKKYLFSGDAAQHDRLAKDEADFDLYHAEYVRLADRDIEQDLARELSELNRRYREAGRELMRLRDRRAVLHAQLAANIEEIDRILADSGFDDPELEAKYRVSLGLVADVSELGAWQGSYLAGMHEPHRRRIAEDLNNIHRHIIDLQDLPLSTGERETVQRIVGVVEQIAASVDGIQDVGDALSGRIGDFGRLREEMDELIDERIQARTRAELRAAHDSVHVNLRHLQRMTLLLIAISSFVSLGAALTIGRRSLQLRDVSVDELRDSLSRLRASEKLRGALLRRLVAAQEQERSRIARELHDQLSQNLSALSLGLASIAGMENGLTGGRDGAQKIRALQDLAGRIAEEVHFVAWSLRPAVLDDLGLHGALSNLAEYWTRHTGVPVDFCGRLVESRLPGECETALYRVAQEALTNVAKHAAAHSVSIVLQSERGEVRLVVEDDGCGFDPAIAVSDGSAPAQLGLVGMKERLGQFGGSLEIDSVVGKGTTIVACIPVDAPTEVGLS